MLKDNATYSPWCRFNASHSLCERRCGFYRQLAGFLGENLQIKPNSLIWSRRHCLNVAASSVKWRMPLAWV